MKNVNQIIERMLDDCEKSHNMSNDPLSLLIKSTRRFTLEEVLYRINNECTCISKNSIDESTLTPKQKQEGVWLSGVEGEGEFKRWRSNGKLCEHSFWKDGNRHGEYKWYDKLGQLCEHSFWKDGNRHGEYKWYDKLGQLFVHSFWKDDNRHGEAKWYYESGQLWQHRLYENGNLVKEYFLSKDNMSIKKIDESTLTPEQKAKGVWLSGVEGEGEFKQWRSNGKLCEHSFWKNGKRHGEYKGYLNGQLREHCFYKDGNRQGECKWYEESGQLCEHCLYENGEIVKEYKI